MDTLKAIRRDAKDILQGYNITALIQADQRVEILVLWPARQALALTLRTDLCIDTRKAMAREHIENAIESAWDLHLPGCGRDRCLSVGAWAAAARA